MERRKNSNQEEEWLRGMNDKVDFIREMLHIARRFKTLGEGKKFALAELKMNIKELKITKRAEIGRNRRKELSKSTIYQPIPNYTIPFKQQKVTLTAGREEVA